MTQKEFEEIKTEWNTEAVFNDKTGKKVFSINLPPHPPQEMIVEGTKFIRSADQSGTPIIYHEV